MKLPAQALLGIFFFLYVLFLPKGQLFVNIDTQVRGRHSPEPDPGKALL